MRAAHASQRLEDLEDAFNKFMNLQIFSRVGLERVLPSFGQACVPAACLQYLPAPKPKSILPYEDEVKMRPKNRSPTATKVSMFLALFAAFISIVVGWLNGEKVDGSILHQLGWHRPNTLKPVHDSALSIQKILQLYTVVAGLAINGLWEAESYRLDFFLTSLNRYCILTLYCSGQVLTTGSSSLPFVIASLFFGWDIVVPLYFANYMRLSQGATFYYPSPRVIRPTVARSLPIAFIVTYAIPIIGTVQTLRGISAASLNINVLLASWQIAHLCFPVTLFICSKVVEIASDSLVPEAFYSTIDIRYQSWFHILIFLVTSTTHLSLFSAYISQFRRGNVHELLVSLDIIRTLLLSLTIAAWCVFTIWDLHRVNITDVTVGWAVFAVLMGSVIFGPAATLTLMWDWRESHIEKARAR